MTSRAFGVFLAATACVGCSGSASSTNTGGSPATKDGSADSAQSAECNAVAPTACPTPSPKYQTDVVPILEAKCNTCHDGKDGGPWPLTDHVEVVDWKNQISSDLLACTMPPPDGTETLTADERTTLLDWLKCGAPNN